jgi:hypothetical protein
MDPGDRKLDRFLRLTEIAVIPIVSSSPSRSTTVAAAVDLFLIVVTPAVVPSHARQVDNALSINAAGSIGRFRPVFALRRSVISARKRHPLWPEEAI